MHRRCLGLALAMALLAAAISRSQTYEIINRAPGFASGFPTGRLLVLADGGFLAALSSGGEFGKGMILRLVPDGLGGLTESEVHSFTGEDGATPRGGLVFGNDGFVYG